MRLRFRALPALTLAACGPSVTEPAPAPVQTLPPVAPVVPLPQGPQPRPVPLWRARIGYALCARVGAAYPSRLPTVSDTIRAEISASSGPVFQLDSAGVPRVGEPVAWVSRDSTILRPGPGGQDQAGRIGTTWLVGTARGASDSVGVQVVADVATDCR